MNNKIQLLAKQAGGEFYTGFAGSPNTVKFTEDKLEQFANLIIRACAQHAVNTDLEDVDGGDSEVLQAARRYILEQFEINNDT